MVNTGVLDDAQETFNVVWADSSIDEGYNETIHTRVRSLLNSLIKFDDADRCRQYLERSSITDRFFVIVSGRFGREIAAKIEKLRQVSSIYVYCMDKKANEQWASKLKKIRAIVVANDELIDALKKDIPVHLQLDEPFSLKPITKSNDDPAIYFQLFLRCLRRMKLNNVDQNDLLDFLENQCQYNDEQLQIIQEYKNNPTSNELLTWFAQNSIFNQILSRALLNEDFHRIFLFHSFLTQLHSQLQQNQPTSPIIIYRSQIISNNEMKLLKNNINQFISLNSSFFGVADRTKALDTLNTVSPSGDMQHVLFEIDADSTIASTKPFAHIGPSAILIMTAPIFHLKSITTDAAKQISIVKMSLCTDADYQSFYRSISVEMNQTGDQSTLRTLARIFWKMNRIDLATFYYKRFIKQLPANDPLLRVIYDDLGLMYLDQKEYEKSVEWFRKSVEAKKQNSSPSKDTSIDYFPDIESNIDRPQCPQMDSCNQSDDEVHMSVYFHNSASVCPDGGECELIKNADHASQYTHPDYCPRGGECTDMSETHLIDYCHVPLCRDGLTCVPFFKGNTAHRMAYRHCKNNCKLRSCCPNFHNHQHIEEENHPFKPPCPYTPYICQYYDQLMTNDNAGSNCVQHCIRYSHVCPFGRYCTKQTDKSHCETNLHIFRKECAQGEHCPLIHDSNHLNSYSHLNMRDIQRLCKYSRSDCPQKSNQQHLKDYRHFGHIYFLGVARYLGSNKQINFIRNQNEMIANIQRYMQASNWNPSTITVPDTILRWIRALQPVHRCSKIVFESILLHGHCMSREHMNSLREPQSVAKAIKSHKAVQEIFAKVAITRLQQSMEEYFHILVAEHFCKHNKTALTKEQTQKLSQLETIFSQLDITDDALKKVRTLVTDIAEASFKLQSSQTGLGWQPDVELGTNKHVFAVLGAHAGYYYGDIIIVFRQEIMHHPDSNFSIHAATTFHKSGNAYSWRPWLKDPGALDKRIEHFHQNKLHCSIPGYEMAAAYELMALTGLSKKSTKDIDVKALVTRWMGLDPHHVFEAHLPQLIPLDYIEKVYMTETTFKSLSSQAQQSARTIFGDMLHTTPHQVTGETPGLKQKIDPPRQAFQTFVMEDTFKVVEQRLNTLPSHQGTCVTLSSSNFREFVHIPMTISQALSQNGSSDVVYIYWEALQGDMSLILTYEMINTEVDQKNLKCLTCHIAKWPKSNIITTSTLTTSDYQEGYSYIGTSHPFTHYHIIQDRKFRASSATFHRGCNTHEYVIYNLVLNRKTSQVTLAIVGSNSLYNQHNLTFTFDKNDLDLTKLEYIQISAGGTVVPVRNFVVQSKPIEKYHPSLDTDLMKANPGTKKVQPLLILQKKPSTASLPVSSPKLQKKVPTVDSAPPPPPPPPPILPKKPSPPSSTAKACPKSIYCQLQYADNEEGKKHIAEFSHPCRFSEVCRRNEPHLVHIPHPIPMCSNDEKCTKRGDPIHRAQYRHTNLPDYLIPCRFQEKCKIISKEDHRIKYFHGEKVPLPS